jgi:flavin reductase (DIM6/NTAB) family NADH-FMN oxidoreductase RutF
MIHYTKKDIIGMDMVPRLSLINSITGYKPGNLIGTKSESGATNLAIFSSVVHLGSDPALIAFIMRPMVGERHTMENILSTGFYTINHISTAIIERAHFTSADFPRDLSEFDRCKLTPQYIKSFYAPYVAESRIKIGMSLAETIPLKINNTIMVIGSVEHIILDSSYQKEDSSIDPIAAGTVCISGIDTYYKTEKLVTLPFVRSNEVPTF